MSTATAYDFNVSQFRRTTQRQTPEPSAEAAFSIFDDLADGIEAIHQCANLAGFTERPRAFIFALATAAHSQSTSCIELYDEELAELQNCSRRTIMRQRDDYLRESRAKNFDFVEIIEGAFDKESMRHKPTMYRFHLGDVVERIVSEARSSKNWHETDRRKQRDALKRAASNVYDEIPEAPPKSRKKNRPRLATSEIETCQKIIRTKFDSLRDKASKLPPNERERLMNSVEPGELYDWWLGLRAEVDDFFNVSSPQTIDKKEDNRGMRQFVTYPPAVTVDAKEAEQVAADQAGHVTVNALKNTHTPSAEDIEAWDQLEGRLTAPQIRRVEVPLTNLEPSVAPYADTPAFDEEPCDEELPEENAADVLENLAAMPEKPETEGQLNELELELDPVEQAEREAVWLEANNLPVEPDPPLDDGEAVQAEGCLAHFIDAEGNTYVPPGVPL